MKHCLEVLVASVITCLPLSHAKCNKAVALSRHYNQVLVGHAIKTIEANYLDCVKTCSETKGCRSINAYKNSSGQEKCDLNKSSKTDYPGSIVSMSGYEHDEIMERNNCAPQDCLDTPSSHWHQFNSSLFQLFKERMTWNEARAFCQSLQGDLASIGSKQEQEFISSTLLKNAPRGNSTNTRLIGLWKLDGTDAEITFHGEAQIIKTIDAFQALYLNGKSTGYATTPGFDIIRRGFSIGAWVNLVSPASPGIIYGDWSSPYQFYIHVNETGTVSFQLHLKLKLILKVQYTSIPFNVWVHVMASWSASNNYLNILIDGQEKARYVIASNISSLDLMYTGHRYDIGLERNQSTVFHGYIRQLAVYSWGVDRKSLALKRIGRTDKYDGVWIGLNDMKKEGSFVYSDGSAVTYVNWANNEPNDMYKFQDCVAISLASETQNWFDKACGLELPFICRKRE